MRYEGFANDAPRYHPSSSIFKVYAIIFNLLEPFILECDFQKKIQILPVLRIRYYNVWIRLENINFYF